MKYIDPITKEKKTVYTKASDTLPLGAIVDFDGEEIPAGWEPAPEDATVYIGPNEPTDGQDIWIQKGKNLFDKNGSIKGEAYGQEGVRVENALWSRTSFIKVHPNTVYSYSSKLISGKSEIQTTLAYWNSDKVWVGETYTTNLIETITTPADCEYIMVQYRNDTLEDIQLELGDKVTDYEPFINKKIYIKNEAGKYDLFVKNRIHIGPEIPTDGEEVWIQASKNAFDTKLLIQGGWNNPDSSERVVWGIKVNAGVKYTISNYSQKRISVFETTNLIQSASNNNVLVEHGSLDGVGNMTITVANNAYLRLLFSNLDNSSISVSDILPSDVQVELGDVATDYEPYLVDKKIYIKNDNSYEEFYDKQIKALWTNSSPKSNFAPQNISLNSSNYDYLIINFISNTTEGEGSSVIIKKGQSVTTRFLTYSRKFTYVDDKTYSVADAYLESSIRNWLNVPIEIIGVKL